MQHCVPALLSLALLAPPLATASSRTPSPRPSQQDVGLAIDSYLEKLTGLGFSGAALVARDGEALLAKGYGQANRAADVANTPDTVFPLGSISKHFTAAAVLRLEMDGKLRTEDTLAAFFENVPPDKKQISVHHLLTHTSGLPEALGMRDASDAESYARAVLRAELIFPPGAEGSYSNLGYGLLAAIVERVAGEPFEAVMQRTLFKPAGMTRTGFSMPDWKQAQLPHGYIDDADTGTLLESLGGSVPFSLKGSGGLQTTLGDMQRWSGALRANTVLSAEAFQKMTTPHVRRGPDVAMGYGCGITNSPLGKRIGHSGSNDVFSAHFHHYLDRDLLVFVATNNADMYSEGPLRGASQVLYGDGAPEAPQTIQMEDSELFAYTGKWATEDGEVVTVGSRTSGLTLSSDSPSAAALLHPVHPRQVDRRAELIHAVEAAFPKAFSGEYEPLHELLDPFAPLDEFVMNEGGFLEQCVGRHGPFQSARAIPGRNRFGEIAVIAELTFESETARIEYSFGDQEVGSIRLLHDLPRRVVYPESPGSFVAYDPEADESWHVGFLLGDTNQPEGLILFDEAGEPHELSRAR